MSSVLDHDEFPTPHIVVVGNQKGGSGKSTLAMHIIVALLKAGKRVASFDLDLYQQTLTRYIDNRRSWAQEQQLSLELPDHCSMADETTVGIERSYAVDLARFVSHLQTIEHDQNKDFIVIDTPGGLHKLSIVAHGIADTIVTPINDSLLDIDVIVKISRRDQRPQPSNYCKMISRVMEARSRICGQAGDWIVVRNRTARSSSRNQRLVGDVLEYVRAELGFRTVPGLPERPIFRELFGAGLTIFDEIESPSSSKVPVPSEPSAQSGIYELMEEIGVTMPRSGSDEAARASPTQHNPGSPTSDALIQFAPPAIRSAAAAIRARRSAARRQRGK
jgi:chromosome partitioning protein